MTDTFLKGFTVRAVTTEDVEAVAKLISTCDIADHGEPDYTLEDLRVDWQNPELNLETDTWI